MQTTPSPNWTHQEFLAYFLLFAAHVDIQYNEDERSHILSKVDKATYEKIWQEFSIDNDYIQIQKIRMYCRLHTKLSQTSLLEELKDLFLSDQHFHLMERTTLNGMRRILS